MNSIVARNLGNWPDRVGELLVKNGELEAENKRLKEQIRLMGDDRVPGI